MLYKLEVFPDQTYTYSLHPHLIVHSFFDVRISLSFRTRAVEPLHIEVIEPTTSSVKKNGIGFSYAQSSDRTEWETAIHGQSEEVQSEEAGQDFEHSRSVEWDFE